jgi:hypothetical protein
MGYAQAVRDEILNFYFRGGAAPTPPSTWYVALLTTNPSDETGTGLVEVSTSNWTNYARQGVTNASASWAAPSGTSPRVVSNAAAVNFGTAATTGNQTITGFALYDAATAGTFKGWAAFGTPPVVQNGDPTSFAISALVIDQ